MLSIFAFLQETALEYTLFIEGKKSAQKIWSNYLVNEKTFRLSSHTPLRYLLASCPE